MWTHIHIFFGLGETLWVSKRFGQVSMCSFKIRNKTMETTKNEKEREKSYQKKKRSQKENHTQAHGNLMEIFWWSQMSFSIRALNKGGTNGKIMLI